MSAVHFRATCALVVLCNLASNMPTKAQVVLHNFTGFPNDGSGPVGSLVPLDSAFYGMTSTGGSAGFGTVFKIGTDGTGYTLLRSFLGGANDGRNPLGSLAQSGGVFYGMTEAAGSGGDGTIFKMNADGTGFGVVHSFQGGAADGNTPLGSPVVSGGVIYGMTSQGGTANLGTVYRTNADGTSFQVIHSFTGAPNDGHFPANSSLIVSGTVMYGVTSEGGSADQGAIFKMNTDGTGFTILHSFVPTTGDGYGPSGGLILTGGVLSGMTRSGGANGVGTIFQINTDGTGYNRLHSFAGSPMDGATPDSNDLLAVGTTLFAMTHDGGANGLGVLLSVNSDGSAYTVDHSFAGGPLDGATPFGSLTELNGVLYATTVQGGSANDGVIFSFTPIPEPGSLALVGTVAAAAGWIARRQRRLRSLP